MARRPDIVVEGLQDLRRAVRRAGDKEIGLRLRVANKNIAREIVSLALARVPVRSGRLRASVRATATQSSAGAKAGSPTRVPYAAAIHWGWPSRHIRSRPFLTDAAAAVERDVVEEYADALALVWRDLSAK